MIRLAVYEILFKNRKLQKVLTSAFFSFPIMVIMVIFLIFFMAIFSIQNNELQFWRLSYKGQNARC